MNTHTIHRLFTLAMLMLTFGSLPAQDTAALHYPVKRSAQTPVVDGLRGNKEWKGMSWSRAFTDITGDPAKKPVYNTKVSMQYDDSALYIIAWMEEPFVNAAMRQHDDLLFKENDFEVFIDPDGDGKDYAEIEINALGTVMDLKLDKAYSEGGKADMTWALPGLRTAVHVLGSLNDNQDRDRGWFAEIAIPYTALTGAGKPSNEHPWRINFLRVEKNTYNKTLYPDENYWAWSPQGAVNMHIPGKWGYLHFTN